MAEVIYSRYINQDINMINFTTRNLSDSIVIVSVAGKMAEQEREHFFNCVGEFVDAGYSHVIVECYGLGFVSSNGLVALLRACKRVNKKGGRICLTHLDSKLAEVLEVTKLGRLLAVYPTTLAAIDSIEQKELACVG